MLESPLAYRLSGDDPATPLLTINWGKFGTYELIVAADGKTFAGSAVGQPENWRKGTRLEAVAAQEAHVHDH